MDPSQQAADRDYELVPLPLVMQKLANDKTKFNIEIAVICFIVVFNCLILIPILATRRQLWPSYFYCLFSTIMMSILFAVYAIPVLNFLGQKDHLILTDVVSCKIFHIVANLLWDCFLINIMLMNVDHIISVLKPNLYISRSYENYAKITLVSFWILSLIINIIIVYNSSLKMDNLYRQPCQQVGNYGHLVVCVSLLLILGLVCVVYFNVLFKEDENDFLRPMNDKWRPYPPCLLFLNILVVAFRLIPELIYLIQFLVDSHLDSDGQKARLDLIVVFTYLCLLVLPCVWLFDPFIKNTIVSAYKRWQRQRDYESISPVPIEQ